MGTTKVRDEFHCDSLSKKGNVFTARVGFFFTHGRTPDCLVVRLGKVFPLATVIDKGMVWKDFRGGASVANQSHYWVKFTL